MIMWKSGTFANVEKTSIWFFFKLKTMILIKIERMHVDNII